MKKRLTDKNYILIADWMLELGLNTRELLIYAIIFGFSQNKDSAYFGSLSYLGEWLGMEKHSENVLRNLKPLLEKELIIKNKIKIKDDKYSEQTQICCHYKINYEKIKNIKTNDIDYLVIQPWMIAELKLKGKDLLLYALIHGYSRKESNNYCLYNKKYLAKWLQCRKDNVDRQVKKLVNEKMIEIIKTESGKEGLKALKQHNPQNESTQKTQFESVIPQNESAATLKLKDNNIYINNINNNVVVKDKNDIFGIFKKNVEDTKKRYIEGGVLNLKQADKAEEYIKRLFVNFEVDKLKLLDQKDWCEVYDVYLRLNGLLDEQIVCRSNKTAYLIGVIKNKIGSF